MSSFAVYIPVPNSCEKEYDLRYTHDTTVPVYDKDGKNVQE